jgi:hypothetical protein
VLPAAHTRVDALYVRFDALEPCVHLAHLLAYLQQQAEQPGRHLVLGRAAIRRARPLELWRHLLVTAMAAVSLSTRRSRCRRPFQLEGHQVVLTTHFDKELDGRAGSALRWHHAKRMMEVDVPGRAAKLFLQLASLRLALP